MVNLEQISALIEFMESHPQLAQGQGGRSIEGRMEGNRRWAECATLLNSISPDCPNKSVNDWRKYYNEYKHRLKKKIELQKREMSATGGVPAKEISLSPLEERLYNILRRDVGEPLADVRHNPFPVRRVPLAQASRLKPQAIREARRRLPRQQPNTEEINHTALADSQQRLERIERRNAAAILSQAEATTNLSEAIDRLGERTSEAVNNMAAATAQLATAIEKIAHSFYQISETIDEK